MFPIKVLVAVIVVVVAIGAGVAIFLMQGTTMPQTPTTTPPTTPTETPSPTPPPSPSPTPTETLTTTPAIVGEVVTYTTMLDLLNNIRHIKFELYVSSPETGEMTAEGSYTITDETVLNGNEVWLITIQYRSTSEGETSELILDVAITKDEGKVVKLTITENGQTTEITGPQLEFMGTMVLQSFFTPLLIFMGSAQALSLTITEIGVISLAEGFSVESVPVTVTIGGNTFNGFEIRFRNLQPSEGEMVEGKVVVAELYANHWFVVEVEGSTTANEYGILKLVEITLTQ